MNKVCTGIFSQPLESMCEKIVSGLMSTFMLPVLLTYPFVPSLSHPVGTRQRGELRNKSLVFKIKFCKTCCHHQVLQYAPHCLAERYAGCGFFNSPLERGKGCANGGTPIFTPRGEFRALSCRRFKLPSPCSIKHIP